LKRRADFLRIAASGLRRVTPAFILQAAAPPTGTAGRVGFTVSRKVGNAVARNRAKRRLRAAADRVLTAPQLFDLVLVGRAEALTRDFAALTADLQQALHAVAKPGRAKSKPAP
jgi:ribonuclease P protein component